MQPPPLSPPPRQGSPVWFAAVIGAILVIAVWAVGDGIHGCKESALEMEKQQAAEQKEQDQAQERELTDPVAGRKPEQSAWGGITPEVDEFLKRKLFDYGSMRVKFCSEVMLVNGFWIQRVQVESKDYRGAVVIEDHLYRMRNGRVVGYDWNYGEK